ncbi:hypothetical protein [Nocardioides sp.]
MTSFLLLLAATTVLALWILRLVETDDRGPLTPPASHPVDDRFLPPARR